MTQQRATGRPSPNGRLLLPLQKSSLAAPYCSRCTTLRTSSHGVHLLPSTHHTCRLPYATYKSSVQKRVWRVGKLRRRAAVLLHCCAIRCVPPRRNTGRAAPLNIARRHFKHSAVRSYSGNAARCDTPSSASSARFASPLRTAAKRTASRRCLPPTRAYYTFAARLAERTRRAWRTRFGKAADRHGERRGHCAFQRWHRAFRLPLSARQRPRSARAMKVEATPVPRYHTYRVRVEDGARERLLLKPLCAAKGDAALWRRTCRRGHPTYMNHAPRRSTAPAFLPARHHPPLSLQ